MSEPDPTYTATMPGTKVLPPRATMPEWLRLYFMQRRRALNTEMVAIEKMLGIKDN